MRMRIRYELLLKWQIAWIPHSMLASNKTRNSFLRHLHPQMRSWHLFFLAFSKNSVSARKSVDQGLFSVFTRKSASTQWKRIEHSTNSVATTKHLSIQPIALCESFQSRSSNIKLICTWICLLPAYQDFFCLSVCVFLSLPLYMRKINSFWVYTYDCFNK